MTEGYEDPKPNIDANLGADDDPDTEKRKKIAEILFPDAQERIEDIYERYPSRELPEGAMVTRFGPSPTGFMHIGGLYAALISERLAHQTDGVFYLRIEDTDKKREVEGAGKLIADSLSEYGLKVDEGEVEPGQEIGKYGPYKQSEREKIYKAFAKKLIQDGTAYPSFDTPEELENITEIQAERKIRPGYYGEWALWRNKTPDEALEMLNQGLKPVIRLKSKGDISKTVHVEDMFRGDVDLPENDQDIVLIKTQGLPTYHLAHVIDDHLMGTTNVVRGDEWLSSLTLHTQLFDLMGWKRPVYGHISPIQKMEGSSRRKLSKRHDPEASASYYSEAGYPPESVVSYLLNLANASFEEWSRSHPKEPLSNYKLSIDELSKRGGALLDLQKMADISKDYIANLSTDERFEKSLVWAKKHDPELATAIEADETYARGIFNIEKKADTVRKDIAKWSEIKNQVAFFFDDMFEKIEIQFNELADISKEDISQIVTRVVDFYDESDSQVVWLTKMRQIAQDLGYAPDAKTYKKNPTVYKGHFGSVAKVVRVLLVGKNQSPELYEVMKVMGKERITKRLSKANSGTV